MFLLTFHVVLSVSTSQSEKGRTGFSLFSQADFYSLNLEQIFSH